MMDMAELLRRLQEVRNEYDNSPNDMDGPCALDQLIKDVEAELPPPVYGLYSGG